MPSLIKREFKTILVLASGTKVDEEAVEFACELAKKNKSKLYVAHVIEIDDTLPLDTEIEEKIQKGESILDEAENTVKRAGWKVETELLQARKSGPAIIDEASECGADLIILGTFYEEKFGEFSLGETIPYVLKHAPCRVILWWEPLKEKAFEG